MSKKRKFPENFVLLSKEKQIENIDSKNYFAKKRILKNTLSEDDVLCRPLYFDECEYVQNLDDFVENFVDNDSFDAEVTQVLWYHMWKHDLVWRKSKQVKCNIHA